MDRQKEIDSIVSLLSSNSEYQGNIYDPKLGFHQGPTILNGISEKDDINLSEDEAAIGIMQPISRMAQHHLLLIKKSKTGWELKKRLKTYEG